MLALNDARRYWASTVIVSSKNKDLSSGVNLTGQDLTYVYRMALIVMTGNLKMLEMASCQFRGSQI